MRPSVALREKSDARVQEIARADALPELNADPTSGKPIYNDTRLVSGTAARGVYALPTTKQLVCLGVFPNGGGVCSSPGADGLTVGYEIAPNSRPSLIYGLLGDDVRGLDVMVSGVTRQAQLGKNAYVLELAHAKGKRLERLILHLRDGTTTVIELS